MNADLKKFPAMPLGEIARRLLGVSADRIRLLKRSDNSHWLVAARADRLVLRRFGNDGLTNRSAESVRWEFQVLDCLAEWGWPVAPPLAEPIEVGGQVYALFPFLGGQRMRPSPPDDHAYRRLGRLLAELHTDLARIEIMGQRPGWRSFVEGAVPAEGGVARREELLSRLARIDAKLAHEVAHQSAYVEARLAELRIAALPRMVIHSDFSPWNLRFRAGRLSAIYDFDLAHLDVAAADVAFARRGYHDAVVAGYLEVAALSDAELDALDALWKGVVLSGIWRTLENWQEGRKVDPKALEWSAAQLIKTRPYEPRSRVLPGQ